MKEEAASGNVLNEDDIDGPDSDSDEHCGIALDESDNSTDLDGDEGEVDALRKSEEYRRQRNLKVTFIPDVRTR
ncbi:hypothetical protein EC991_010258 [Linnemannia zychae]|nr:hypothetical protein EC991_010258 [Linnemannia zychae]